MEDDQDELDHFFFTCAIRNIFLLEFSLSTCKMIFFFFFLLFNGIIIELLPFLNKR